MRINFSIKLWGHPMIHIDYPGSRRPPKAWLQKANELTEQLKRAPNKAARDKIIDDNAKIWGEIKEWLQKFSNDKCWFSEARDSYSHWQVEHFRPKKEAKEPDREGYWWRTFDYLNYRLCGSVGNAKKGSYFPLRAGTQAATAAGPSRNCKDEAPVLIDPTLAGDVILLTFSRGGKAVPASSDDWERERAEKSIQRYKLNDHPALLRARETVWNRSRLDVSAMQNLMVERKEGHCAASNRDFETIAKRVSDRTRSNAQFSAVARAFLSQDRRKWVRRLVT
jgi:hypothetical protein